MKKVPRWAWWILGTGVAVLLILLVLPAFLDADRYRPQIVSLLAEETGREVRIEKIRARLVPRIGLVVEGFAMGHPSGFVPEGSGEFLSAEQVRANIAWGPLFRRQIALSSIEILRPKLVLLEDDRGRTSYDFTPPKKTAKAPAEEGGFRLADIDTITIRDLELIYGRVAGSRRTVVPSVRAWGLRGRLRDVALDAKRIRDWKAEGDLSGIRVEVPGLRGPIELRSGEFKMNEGAIESQFDAEVASAARVKGTVRVADIQKAVAEFDLSTARLDLDQLAAVETPGKAAAAPPPAQRPGKSELVARGKLRVERLRWAPYEASGAHADVRIFTDRAEVWPAQAAVAGGSLGISVRIDRRTAPERFSANVEAQNIDVAKLLSASPQTKGKLSGTGELKLQLNGAFGPKLLDTLGGSGNAAIRNGKLPGVDLSKTMQALNRVQQVLNLGRGGSQEASGETPFRALTGDLSLAKGRVSSNRIHLDSPSGTVDLRGSFGFDGTLNYDGQAVLTPTAEGASQSPTGILAGAIGGITGQRIERLSVPFAVRGTFSDPKVQPGRGIPGLRTTQPAEQPADQTEEKKRNILDLFRRP